MSDSTPDDDAVTEAITVPLAKPAPSPRAPEPPPAVPPAPPVADSSASPEVGDSSSTAGGPDATGRELAVPTRGQHDIGGASPAHRRREDPRRWWMKAAAVALCALLGLSLAAQLRRNEKDGALAGARQEDLVRILDELDSREQRLRSEIAELQERRRTLSSAAEGSQTVQEDLERRSEELGILAGTIPAEGAGLRLTFRPGSSALSAELILDAVEELRGAGAEAMQMGGRTGSPVRIVAATAFLDTEDDHLLVGNHDLSGPYTLLAIGDPETMRAALAIPGGVVDSVEDAGGKLQIDTPNPVTVSATLSPATPRYAEPVD
ncbi:DUF881 domain-containing protein [Cryptosporangium sp. NPDC048952]|uniref:DUF881 domain-containing protein n=1 Tax=Cryptosporangium sp. NPDC048952 TaxID=3363961 RepID=UPI00371402D4